MAMNDPDNLVRDMAERLFADLADPAALADGELGPRFGASWARLAELGLTLALVPEEAGGLGTATTEALTLVRLAGRHALPLPLAETMAANAMLAASGLPVEPGAVTTLAVSGEPTLARAGEGWHLTGTFRRVPWARAAATVAVLAPGVDGLRVVALPAGAFTLTPGGNLADEPRDDMAVDAVLGADAVGNAPAGWDAGYGERLGALLRAVAMAGSLQTVLDKSISYAGERSQFGKPIGRFQAVQQNLALMAGHTAAAVAAAEAAAAALAADARMLPIAAAKIRCGEAASVVAAMAHQVHGAIGFTREHSLHHFTRRLWSWRDEYGDEAAWSLRLGTAVAAAGPDQLWPIITSA